MTYRTDSSYSVDDGYEDDDDEPRRGLLSWILIVAMLMGTGGASAVIWRTFGGGSILPALASNKAPAATGAVAQLPPAQPDLAALRQEITGSVQSTQALLAAQQAEIKRLSEQVSTLSSKLELMQRPVSSAQAAIPVPAPPAPKQKSEAKPAAAKPAPRKPAEARHTEPKPAENKPAENKPASGPISTGGTPLQLSR